MAVSPAQRKSRSCRMLTFAWLFMASLLNAGVMAQSEEEVITATTPPVRSVEFVRGDMVPTDKAEADDPHTPQVQILVFPTVGDIDLATPSTAAPVPQGDEDVGQNVPEQDGEMGDEVVTQAPVVSESESQTVDPAEPARGDGPVNIPEQPLPLSDVTCVDKEAVRDKDAVSLKLKMASNCEDTRVKIASVLQQLCDEDCKLEIYQEDNSSEILISGQYVQDDTAGMADRFNNDNIKDKVDVDEAVPRWGKNSKLVLVSLLLSGLLLAALLVAGYYLKTHRKNAKGVRLAESFQVDEENQANTLVSVAPLPQEPVDKPTTNGESPPENGTNPASPTNGHSTTQTPVADTEM